MVKSRRFIGAAIVTWLLLSACGGEAMRSGQGSGGASPTGGDAGGGLVSFGGSSTVSAGAPASAGQAIGGHVGLGGAPSKGGAGFGGVVLNPGGAGGALPEGGAAGEGGDAAAGGASNCAPMACASSCPGERWSGLDGCPTCACAPPAPELTSGSWSCPSNQLSVTSSSSTYVGGVNRWLISLEWTCSAVGLGTPARAKLEVGLIQPMNPPLDATNRTFLWDSTHPLQDYEVRSATIWLRGSGVPEIAVNLLPSTSLLSIRREGAQLVGGVSYEGADSTNSNHSTLAAPFSVPVPKF